MSLIFQNAGNPAEFDTHGAYVTNQSSTYTKTGIAFNCLDSDPVKVNVPSLMDVWCKLDYFVNRRGYCYPQAYPNDNPQLGLHFTDSWSIYGFFGAEYDCVGGAIQTIKLHFDVTNDIAELYIDGKLAARKESAGFGGNPITSFSFSTSRWNFNYPNFMSNITVSDSEIADDTLVKFTWRNNSGSCLYFDGNNYIELPSALLDGRKAFSLSLDFATMQCSSSDFWSHPALIGINKTGQHCGGWNLSTKNGNLFLFNAMGENDGASYGSGVEWDGKDSGYDTGVFVSDGNRHNVKLVDDGSKFTIFVDGVECAEHLPVTMDCISDPVYIARAVSTSTMRLYSLTFYDENGSEIAKYDKMEDSYNADNLIDSVGNYSVSYNHGIVSLVEPSSLIDIRAQTHRNIQKSVSTPFSTSRTVVADVSFSANTKRAVQKTVSTEYPTSRNLEAIVNQIFYTMRKIVFHVGTVENFVLQANHADSATKVAGIPVGQTASGFTGWPIKSMSLTIAANTLSDKITMELVANMKPNDAMQGDFLGYKFDMLVESVTQKGIEPSIGGKYALQRITSMYKMDELLTIPRRLNISTKAKTVTYENGVKTVTELTAVNKDIAGNSMTDNQLRFSGQAVAMMVANSVGLTPCLLFDNFLSDSYYTAKQTITYKNLLSQNFGWTTSLPWRQINIFVRGDTLYFVERGKEPCVVNIDDYNTTIPQISKSIYRTEWQLVDNNSSSTTTTTSGDSGDSGGGGGGDDDSGSGKDDDGKDNDKDKGYSLPVPRPIYFSGTLRCGNTVLSYSNGLCVEKTVVSPYDMKTITYYAKMSYDSERRMVSKDEQSENGHIKTDVSYASDTDNSSNTTTESELADDGSIITQTVTVSVDLGNGFVGTSTYVDGEYQGSTISGSGVLSSGAYQTGESNKRLSRGKSGYKMPDGSEEKPDGRIKGRTSKSGSVPNSTSKSGSVPNSLYTSNLPKTLLQLFAAEIKSYNRSIQETISLDIISRISNGKIEDSHIIDFTDKILYRGNTYYLVSNTVTLNTSEFKQALTFTRWVK